VIAVTVDSQPTYRPAARRPIAGLFRRTAESAVRFCLRAGIHADAVSYGSIVVSAAAAVSFLQSGQAAWLLIPAALLCYLRLWLNMLDGMVALASGKASLRGEILNDLPDRISDVLIFVGAAHSGFCHPLTGYWAAILALLTAYVGTLGQAVGVRREFSGLMSKPWRMVALHVGSWILLADLWWAGWTSSWRLSILDWTHLVIIAGCLQTITVRLARILRALKQRSPREERP
jgi:phosphatidylglycerophosphate synthase